MKSLDKLLRREQKESIIEARLVASRPDIANAIAVVRYDERFGFDFEVVRGPANRARVTFSTPLSAEKFQLVVDRCAEAVWQIRFGGTMAKALRETVDDHEGDRRIA